METKKELYCGVCERSDELFMYVTNEGDWICQGCSSTWDKLVTPHPWPLPAKPHCLPRPYKVPR